jgi:TonB family protein
VSIENRAIEISSNSKECSRVDYLVEGQPFVALVIGGEEQAKWPGQPLNAPEILVERCLVCWDGSVNDAGEGAVFPAPEQSAAAEPSDRPPAPIIQVLPSYPPNAWVAELEGHVVVEFTVASDGMVQTAQVVESSDPVFDAAALEAIKRFRYEAGLVNGEPAEVEGVRERFDFRLAEDSSATVVTME